VLLLYSLLQWRGRRRIPTHRLLPWIVRSKVEQP